MYKPTSLFLLTALFGAAVVSSAEITPEVYTCRNDIPATAPESRFAIDQTNGTLEDKSTGLMWKLCAEGQTAPYCMNLAMTYTWQEALQEAADSTFAGHGDWRLPNIKELASLIEARCVAPAINLGVFRGTPAEPFWSSSSSTANARQAWVVDFHTGELSTVLKSDIETARVRLVRDLN